LQENNARADDEEAEDNVDYLYHCAVQTLEQYRAGQDRRGGEVDVVCGRYQSCVEEIERFLLRRSAYTQPSQSHATYIQIDDLRQ